MIDEILRIKTIIIVTPSTNIAPSGLQNIITIILDSPELCLKNRSWFLTFLKPNKASWNTVKKPRLVACYDKMSSIFFFFCYKINKHF